MHLDQPDLGDRVLGAGEPVRTPIGDELRAELATGLLVGRRQEHEVALERHPRALEGEQSRQVQDARRLHVDRAAPVEVAVGDDASERVDRPVAPVGVYDVDVMVQDDSAEGAVALQARAQTGAPGARLDRLALDALARQDLGQKPRAGDLVAGGIGGVDLQIAAQELDRLVAQRPPVGHRPSASGVIASTSPSSHRAMWQ